MKALHYLLLASLAACATTEPAADYSSAAASYDARIIGIAPPADAGQHAEVCRYLRVELARAHSSLDGIGQANNPEANHVRSRFRQSAAVIESKMAEFGCDRPYQS